MKKRNIILIGIVGIVVVICILAVVIGFGLSEKKDKDKNKDKDNSVNLSQGIDDEEESNAETSKDASKETSEEESTEETEEPTTDEFVNDDVAVEETTLLDKDEEEETSLPDEDREEETSLQEVEKEEETTTSVQREPLDRLSYEYMMIDGESVYKEYNTKIMELYECINSERAKAGASILTFDTKISHIACAMASKAAYEKVIESSENVKYYDLMTEAGIAFTKAVENTAAGYESAKEVVNSTGTSWKTSTKHYDNMISDKYTRVGVGVDYSEDLGYIWVAIFSN